VVFPGTSSTLLCNQLLGSVTYFEHRAAWIEVGGSSHHSESREEHRREMFVGSVLSQLNDMFSLFIINLYLLHTEKGISLPEPS